MQKLMAKNPFDPLRNAAGSALVGAVAFSIILLIASVGYLQMLGSTNNNELESLRDDKAFVAAESGLLMAAAWLSRQYAIPADTVDDLFTLQFGDITVTTDINPVSVDEAEIEATATSALMGYSKTITQLVGPLPAGHYGTFLNGVLGNNFRAQGGFMNTTFDGPTHANEHIVVATSGGGVVARFLDRTTVHHTDADHWDYGPGAHHSNNYNYGVEIGKGVAHGASWLDKNVFKDEYRSHQPELTLPPVSTQDIMLPASEPASFADSENPEKRAYLELNGSSATYHYYQGGVKKEATYDIDNKVIRAENEICVAGTLSGKSTVVTDSGYNIFPVGNITYAGFTPDAEASYENFDHANNYGVPLSDSSTLALVSGMDIYFADKWHNPVTDSPEYIRGGAPGDPVYITASMIALEKQGTHRFVPKGGDSTDINVNNYDNHPPHGGFRIVGSRTLDEWLQFSSGATKAEEFFRVFFDRRLSDGLSAPGVSGYKRILSSGDTALVLDMGTWSEGNSPN